MPMTQLERFIFTAPMVDTHEHLWSENKYVHDGPDILQDLFGTYVSADLVVAGMSVEALDKALDKANPDIAARFDLIKPFWEHCQFTGYGEAVSLIAKEVYGLAELTSEGLAEANKGRESLKQPGERLRLLKEVAKLDHVQIDNFELVCKPDSSGLDFFLYDLSWVKFVNAELDVKFIFFETGIDLKSIGDLRVAISALFAKYGPLAIAIKTQHAYNRTLLWEPRSDAEAEKVLQKLLGGEELSVGERLCLGDWCFARGIEQALEHNLPIKIHTGYYAGHSRMPVEFIKPGHLSELLKTYPAARFVLMHTGYPYTQEILALAKHYPNVYLDMCWAWSIDPYRSVDVIRNFIHAVPSNKLFAFGGDTFWPGAALAYSIQTRKWLARALKAEVSDGYLTEAQAIALAGKMMRENQLACFDVEGLRARLKTATP